MNKKPEKTHNIFINFYQKKYFMYFSTWRKNKIPRCNLKETCTSDSKSNTEKTYKPALTSQGQLWDEELPHEPFLSGQGKPLAALLLCIPTL